MFLTQMKWSDEREMVSLLCAVEGRDLQALEVKAVSAGAKPT